MRSPRRARWAWCALALLFPVPQAAADQKTRTLDCADFTQRDRSEGAGLELQISSTCEPTIRCALRWELTCAPDTKREKTTREAVTFELDAGQSDGATASAAACDDDAWSIGEIVWNCEPV